MDKHDRRESIDSLIRITTNADEITALSSKLQGEIDRLSQEVVRLSQIEEAARKLVASTELGHEEERWSAFAVFTRANTWGRWEDLVKALREEGK